MPEADACKASKAGRPYDQKKDLVIFFVPTLPLPVGMEEEWSQTLFFTLL